MKQNKVDITLAICVTVLLMIGSLMVFSASSWMADSRFGSLTYFFRKQIFWVFLSIIIMILFSKIDYRKLKAPGRPFLLVIITIALLAGLFFAGRTVNGATRAYSLGWMNFQPSELAKLTVIIYFAYYLSSRGDRLHNFKSGILPLMFVLLSIVLLILPQPDLSTALMILLVAGIMLFISRARITHIIAMALPVIPAVIYMMSRRSYQSGRIRAWLNGLEDPQNAPYQVLQSLLGLGSGGWLGKGLGQSKQKFFYLPDSHTDFIFSITGEELGFVGTTVILILFLIILYRGIRIASKVPDYFGKFLAIGISVHIAIYAFINTAVISMLLPVTGLPMPFISYGGSHLLFLGIGVGILLNLSRHTGPEGASDNWREFRERREKMYRTMITAG